MTIFVVFAVALIVCLIMRSKIKSTKNEAKSENSSGHGKVKTGNFKTSFWNDSDYENERNLLEIMNDATPFVHINKEVPSKQKQEQFDACYKENQHKLRHLIESGALMVIASGSDPALEQGNAEEIDVFTPQVVIQKRPYFATRVVTAAISSSEIIRVAKGYDKITERRQVSVGTQATLGGIIGGSTGAIIGAANAIQKNAEGGEKITTGLKAYYGLECGYGLGTIDAIYISTAVIDKIGEPPMHFVVSKTKSYWLLEDKRTAYSGNGMIGGYDGTAHEECVNYIKKALQFYSEGCKYKNGRFAILKQNTQ